MKKRVLIGIFSLLSMAGIAQSNLADSLAKQGDYYINTSPPSVYNPQKAMGFYLQSASLGNARAMNAVGMCHRMGYGVPVSRKTAIQWFTKAANAGYAKAWNNLGEAYKDARDFTSAYQNYSKGANANDPQSTYMQAYMLYKGFGCIQNYQQAAEIFRAGSYAGRDNYMYFYGLCLRNGYGVDANVDSARYWLSKAAAKGNQQAFHELSLKEPENIGTVGTVLADKIKAAQAAMPNTNNTANQYQKVEHSVDANEVAGTYTGYLLKYDWSGQHVIEANKLTVTLEYDQDSLRGVWKEDDSLTIPIHALLSSNALVFRQMQYSKTNHYCDRPELSIFKKATLQLDKIDDSVYLSGNIQEFIPSINEPTKPLFLALVRTKSGSSNEMISEAPLRAYPQPFP